MVTTSMEKRGVGMMVDADAQQPCSSRSMTKPSSHGSSSSSGGCHLEKVHVNVMQHLPPDDPAAAAGLVDDCDDPSATYGGSSSLAQSSVHRRVMSWTMMRRGSRQKDGKKKNGNKNKGSSRRRRSSHESRRSSWFSSKGGSHGSHASGHGHHRFSLKRLSMNMGRRASASDSPVEADGASHHSSSDVNQSGSGSRRYDDRRFDVRQRSSEVGSVASWFPFGRYSMKRRPSDFSGSTGGHPNSKRRSISDGLTPLQKYWSRMATTREVSPDDDDDESIKSSSYWDEVKMSASLKWRSMVRIFQTAVAHPIILFYTIATFAVLCAGLLTVVLLYAQTYERNLRTEAANRATVMGRRIPRELEKAMLPLFTLEQMVRQTDDFHDVPFKTARAPMFTTSTGRVFRNVTGICDDPTYMEPYEEIAASIKASAKMPKILVNVQLAPFGVVCLLHPLINTEDFDDGLVMDNRGARGLELLFDPVNGYYTREAIKNDRVTIQGPIRLVQGNTPIVKEALIARTPVFREGHNFTIDGVDYDFWGFTTVLLNWAKLKEQVGLAEFFSKFGMEFVMTRTDTLLNFTTMENYKRVAKIAESDGSDLLHDGNSISVPLTTTDNEWVLTVGMADGFTAPWKVGACVGVIVGSIIVSLALMYVLVCKKEHELLLYRMMPREVVHRLQRGETIIEKYDLATICFFDIVSFTTMSGQMKPIEVMSMLKVLYTEFDKLAAEHEVYNVETIGDAYIVIGGGPERCFGREGAEKVAAFAFNAIKAVKNLQFDNESSVSIRAGLASGLVIAGVVGTELPKYTLFGDTVTLASRMESTSRSMQVQCSDLTCRLLRDSPNYRFILSERADNTNHSRRSWWIHGMTKRKAVDKGTEQSPYYLPGICLTRKRDSLRSAGTDHLFPDGDETENAANGFSASLRFYPAEKPVVAIGSDESYGQSSPEDDAIDEEMCIYPNGTRGKDNDSVEVRRSTPDRSAGGDRRRSSMRSSMRTGSMRRLSACSTGSVALNAPEELEDDSVEAEEMCRNRPSMRRSRRNGSLRRLSACSTGSVSLNAPEELEKILLDDDEICKNRPPMRPSMRSGSLRRLSACSTGSVSLNAPEEAEKNHLDDDDELCKTRPSMRPSMRSGSLRRLSACSTGSVSVNAPEGRETNRRGVERKASMRSLCSTGSIPEDFPMDDIDVVSKLHVNVDGEVDTPSVLFSSGDHVSNIGGDLPESSFGMPDEGKGAICEAVSVRSTGIVGSAGVLIDSNSKRSDECNQPSCVSERSSTRSTQSTSVNTPTDAMGSGAVMPMQVESPGSVFRIRTEGSFAYNVSDKDLKGTPVECTSPRQKSPARVENKEEKQVERRRSSFLSQVSSSSSKNTEEKRYGRRRSSLISLGSVRSLSSTGSVSVNAPIDVDEIDAPIRRRYERKGSVRSLCSTGSIPEDYPMGIVGQSKVNAVKDIESHVSTLHLHNEDAVSAGCPIGGATGNREKQPVSAGQDLIARKRSFVAVETSPNNRRPSALSSGSESLSLGSLGSMDSMSPFESRQNVNRRGSETSQDSSGSPIQSKSSLCAGDLVGNSTDYDDDGSSVTSRSSDGGGFEVVSIYSKESTAFHGYWSRLAKENDAWQGTEIDEDEDVRCWTALRSVISMRWRSVKYTVKTAVTHRNILFATIATFAVICAAGLTVVLVFANEYEASRQIDAINKAADADNLITAELNKALLPLFELAELVKHLDVFRGLGDKMGNTTKYPKGGRTFRNVTGICDDPYYNIPFDDIGGELKKDADLPKILVTLSLAPLGVACLFSPLVNTEDFEDGLSLNNTGARGHDLMDDPIAGFYTREAIVGDRATIQGPLSLIQGGTPVVGETLIARNPIFLDGYNFTVDGIDYPFWGFAVALLNWAQIKEHSDLYDFFDRNGMQFILTRTDTMLNVTTREESQRVVVIAESERSEVINEANSISVPLQATDNDWVLVVGVESGLSPPWKVWGCVCVVAGAFFVAISLMTVIVSSTEHKLLLYRMMPRNAIRRLQRGETVVERNGLATIFFSHIIGFTTLSGQMKPTEFMIMLNQIYEEFDKLISQHGVNKVETIGDAYIVTGNDKCDGREGAERVALFAIDAVSVVKNFRYKDMRVFIRAGLASGPMVAGVIGAALPKYTIFGDTVNFASRMESTSKSMKIQCSGATRQLLRDSARFDFDLEERREGGESGIHIKGKGVVLTWWIKGLKRRVSEKVCVESLPMHDVDTRRMSGASSDPDARRASAVSSIVNSDLGVSPLSENRRRRVSFQEKLEESQKSFLSALTSHIKG